jgi:phage-related protein
MDTFDIYLDDYHLHSLSERLPTVVNSMSGLRLPAIRLESYDNPGEHGQTITNTLYGERAISIQGHIRGDSVDEYRTNYDALIQAVSLQNDPLGNPVFRTLKLVTPTRTRQLQVVTKDFDGDEVNPSHNSWKLELTGAQWALSSDQLTSVTVGLPQPGGLTWPTTWPVRWNGGTTGRVTVSNAGSVAAFPTITIPGPVINPVLTNETTGERIGLNLTLGSGDTIVINLFERTVTQGGATNRMGFLAPTSSWWTLVPGENVLSYSADAYDSSQAEIDFYAAYGGF